MIKIIYGAKGNGKTKEIIELANDGMNTEKGCVVFLSDTDRYMFELNRQIRFADTEKADIKTKDSLCGFINGLIAGNADISKIYIDGLSRILPDDYEEFVLCFEKLCETKSVCGVLTLSVETLPKSLEKYS